MNNIVFKVAPKGEGKTRWLLEVAYDHNTYDNMYLIVDSQERYDRFCEKYANRYHHICPAKCSLTDSGSFIPVGAVVLIDDFMRCNISTEMLKNLKSLCSKVFVTVEGNTTYSVIDMNQTYMFDNEVAQNA